MRRCAAYLLAGYAVFIVIFVLLKFDGSFQRIIDVRGSILWTRALGDLEVNLQLGRNIQSYLAMPFTAGGGLVRIVGGIALYAPFGVLAVCMARRPGSFRAFAAAWGCAVAAVTVVEVLQMVLAIGFFDVDDIALGVAGGLLGAVLGTLLPRVLLLRGNRS